MTNTEPTKYLIPAGNLETLKAKIAELARRAERVARRGGLTDAAPITLNVGDIVRRESHREGRKVIELFYECTVTGGAPRVAGWSFVATIQHTAEGNIVRRVPSAYDRDIDLTWYRDAAPACAHCGMDRRRADTFVVANATDTKQVGRSCLGDFLGFASPDALARLAEIMAAVDEACEGGEGGFGGGECVADVEDFLGHVAAMIREGGWISRTKARELEKSATADRAWRNRFPSPMMPKKDLLEVTEADRALAAEALIWAAALEERTDLSDYEHNLRVALTSGVVRHRTSGIIASVIAAYQRAEGIRRERAARPVSVHVGTVGKRETFDATLERVFSFETQYGTSHVHKFRTDDGAVLVWKTGSAFLETGRYRVTGTIKAHDEYKGEAQTILTRCRAEAV